jgi:hypothetical protein
LTLKVMNSSEELVDAPAEGPFGPGWASVAVMASTRRQTLRPLRSPPPQKSSSRPSASMMQSTSS